MSVDTESRGSSERERPASPYEVCADSDADEYEEPFSAALPDIEIEDAPEQRVYFK
jgi:hypothetical protein